MLCALAHRSAVLLTFVQLSCRRAIVDVADREVMSTSSRNVAPAVLARSNFLLEWDPENADSVGYELFYCRQTVSVPYQVGILTVPYQVGILTCLLGDHGHARM